MEASLGVVHATAKRAHAEGRLTRMMEYWRPSTGLLSTRWLRHPLHRLFQRQ